MIETDNCIVLRIDAADKDALQTKLFLLLQTEQYDDALTLIGSDSDSEDPHDFEKTYSLYRLQREAEAAKGLKVLKENVDEEDEEEGRGVLHLEAQLVSLCSIDRRCVLILIK